MAAVCAKCSSKLEDGITKCPSCGAVLNNEGSFLELLGWVVMLIASIPIIIGTKTIDQSYYYPMIIGGVIAVVGGVLIVMGRGKSRTLNTVVHKDPEPGTLPQQPGA